MPAQWQYLLVVSILLMTVTSVAVWLFVYSRKLRDERSLNRKTLAAAAERLILYQKQLLFLQNKIQQDDRHNILENFLRETTICACIINHAGSVVSINPVLQEKLGKSQIDVLLQPYQQVLKLTDVYGNPAYSAIEDSLKGKSGIFPEWVFLETKTGKTAIAGAVSLYTESGLRNLSVIFMDATKAYTDDQAKDEEIRGLRDELSVLRQELKSVSETDRYLRRYFTTTDMNMVFLDPVGRIVSLNPCAQRIFGKSEEDIRGQLYQHGISFLDKSDKPAYQTIADALKGIESKLKHWTFITSVNGKIPVSGSVLPLKDGTKVNGVVIGFRDASQDYQLEQEEKAFFSGAAHDLRAPLTTIRSVIELLYDSYDSVPKPQALEILKGAKESAVHLVSLVNDLLNVSRIDQGKIEVVKSAFDVTVLTKEIMDSHRMVARERHLYLNQEVAEFVPKVYGDKAKSLDILTNLVTNALKYTHFGGVTIKHTKEGGRIITSVTDTGTGISDQNRHLLFKKFQQVGTARNQPLAKSTGLGLYIAKKFATMMGGDIELVQSEIGKGSTFAFSLPIAPSQA
ncbi:hypothetical protein A2Z33_01415 [Candidatus Gottesmanbacteria bacterium RBG_16_52_11]|uniref:histidine kinase n=1 Tax=Candidatus Gottesmanbacteria bacterium RBG_16_52_11 TaxID=1798374 RepID=A0A1F5YPH3_9BACT|nr:MAG: hypothetical protein A2Z33_01415 [Candidatus Gottesmanbacteria bacterium RBG_16_52_11]